MNLLLPHHQQLIDESAIAPEIAAQRGYRSIEKKLELEGFGFSRAQARVPALLIPLHNVHGELAGYLLRPDEPRQIRDRIAKYEMPKDSKMVVDVPPSVRGRLGDPLAPLFITEGSRKADAAASQGLACISLTGVWCWRGTNDRGGKTALPDFESIALEGREVYLVFDSDVMIKEAVYLALERLAEFLKTRKAKVRFVYLPTGDGGRKVGLDDYLAADRGIDDLLQLASSELRKRPLSHADQLYEETADGIFWHKSSDQIIRLTNFTARIVSDVTVDDGVELEQHLEIEGSLRGRTRTFEISAPSLPAMAWPVKELGAGAIIEPGQGTKDRARHAIQTLSGEIHTKTAFGHLGWREIEGEHYYLHAGGAIGARGVLSDLEITVSEPLSRFILPAPPHGSELKAAIRGTLGLLEVVKDEVAFALLGMLGRAPLGPLDWTLWLFGETGTFKSELAALCQQHWGPDLDARHLPASFVATANFTEGLLFEAKDAVTVIDDFAPDGTSFDMQRAQKDVARLTRGQGNSQGRGRMRADGGLRPPKPSRSSVISTGEEVPRGHSIRARSLLCALESGDVDVEKLTAIQRLAADGVLAQSMAGYVRFLAADYEERISALKEDARATRDEVARAGLHPRTPGALADLLVGAGLFFEFAVGAGAISVEEDCALRARAREAVERLGHHQAAYLASGEPTARFLELLGSALSSGTAHVADPSGAEPEEPQVWGWREVEAGTSTTWRPQGNRLGWTDGTDLWLDPDAALVAIHELSRRAAEPFPTSRGTLLKRLAERGLLASTDLDSGRNCVPIRKSIGGKRQQVLHLKASLLVTSERPEPLLEPEPGRAGRVPDQGDLGGEGEGAERVSHSPLPGTEGGDEDPDHPDQVRDATPAEEAEAARVQRKFGVLEDPEA